MLRLSRATSGRAKLRRKQLKSNFKRRKKPNNEGQQLEQQTAPRRPTFVLLLLLLLLLPANQQCHASTLTDFDGATFYKAPVGSRVRIACNGTHWADDAVSLVLWFKGTIERHSAPIYTVDARQRPLNGGARHFVADAYKGRAKFVTKVTPPYLDLAPLEEEDQSEYRCRIDYRSKPRENFLIILFVLVAPKSVHIMDSNGGSLEQIYGPLSEASNLTLVCISKGGRPAPALTWRRRTKVIDDSYLTLNDFLALKQSGQLLFPSQNRVAGRERADEAIQAAPSPSSSSSPSSALSLASLLTFSSPTGANSSSWLLRRGQENNDHDNNDNNQQLWRRMNSINAPASADPSQLEQLANGQLEALLLEWKSWPEYEFFSRQTLLMMMMMSAADADELQLRPTPTNSSTTMGAAQQRTGPSLSNSAQQEELYLELQADQTSGEHRKQTGGHQGAGSGSGPGANQQEQLLSLRVHESITTAVNVLKLSNLVHQLGLGTAQTGGDSFAAGTQSQLSAQRAGGGHNGRFEGAGGPGQELRLAQIECQASNLHYDLRTLIKLFAPPSLSGATRQAAPISLPAAQRLPQGQQQAGNTHAQELTLGRQLVWAINRALEGALRGADQAAHNLASEAAASRRVGQQAKLTETANNSTAQADLFLPSTSQADSAQEPRASQVSAAVGLLYQQVARPHQLSNAQLITAAALDQQQGGAGDSQQLVRSKLIALDIYLRPLDVRISAPQRPLAAGQLAEFSCSSSGSQPAARLSWFKNSQPLEAKLARQMSEPSGNASLSKLSLHLEREDHGAVLVCRAENEQLTRLRAASVAANGSSNDKELTAAQPAAIEDSVTLTVHYPPKVRLELGNKMLSTEIREGTDIYFVCQIDSMPPIKEITWLHNERQVNESVSAQRASSAANNAAASSSAPLGSTEPGGGLIISNNSLVLQRVRVEQRGVYACMASNSEGLSESNSMELRVLHAPTCVLPSAPRAAGQLSEPSELLVASRRLPLKASAKLLCQMEADPAELEVSWYLNNTFNEHRVLSGGRQSQSGSAKANKRNHEQQPGGGSGSGSRLGVKRPPNNSAPTIGSSQLNYLVDTGLDYGRVYCVARNAIGQQKRACVYEIQQPEADWERAPLSCEAHNVTASSAWVACEGGSLARNEQQQQQPSQFKFSIEVFQLSTSELDPALDEPLASSPTGELEANLTSAPLSEPLFSLDNLRPGAHYRLAVRLVNAFTGSRTEPAAEFEFSTLGAHSSGATLEPASNEPSLGGPISTAPLAPNQLSALISTRSTNGHQSAAEQLGRFRLATPFQSAQPPVGWWGRASELLREKLARLVQTQPGLPTGAGNKPSSPSQAAAESQQQQQQQRRLMEGDSGKLLLGLAALVLLGSLAALLSHQRLANACNSPGRNGNKPATAQNRSRKGAKRQESKRAATMSTPPHARTKANFNGSSADSKVNHHAECGASATNRSIGANRVAAARCQSPAGSELSAAGREPSRAADAAALSESANLTGGQLPHSSALGLEPAGAARGAAGRRLGAATLNGSSSPRNFGRAFVLAADYAFGGGGFGDSLAAAAANNNTPLEAATLNGALGQPTLPRHSTGASAASRLGKSRSSLCLDGASSSFSKQARSKQLAAHRLIHLASPAGEPGALISDANFANDSLLDGAASAGRQPGAGWPSGEQFQLAHHHQLLLSNQQASQHHFEAGKRRQRDLSHLANALPLANGDLFGSLCESTVRHAPLASQYESATATAAAASVRDGLIGSNQALDEPCVAALLASQQGAASCGEQQQRQQEAKANAEQLLGVVVLATQSHNNKQSPANHPAQFQQSRLNAHSSSLLSDESSDSHRTWSALANCNNMLRNADTNDAHFNGGDLQQAAQFLELLPGERLNLDCLSSAEMELMNKMMMSPSCLATSQPQQQQMFAQDESRVCISLASPSAGSSSLCNEQAAGPSPLSLTNTTLSNATNTESLAAANNNAQGARHAAHVSSRSNALGPNKLTSILKNSSSNSSLLYQQAGAAKHELRPEQKRPLCQCNPRGEFDLEVEECL